MLNRGIGACVILVWLWMIPAVCSSPIAVAHPPKSASYAQVVAHPDDDILFMNPDLADSIRSGAEVTSIYLTAGESDVVPAGRYAAGRQNGTRSAFAGMAAVPDEWAREVLPVPGRRSVEVDTLRDRPNVRLVFVNLPDDNNPRVAGGKHALQRLWHDRTGLVRVRTLRPEGSPIRDGAVYDRAAVLSTLAVLYERFAPTILRTQDPQPDERYQPQWGRHHNHPDHVAVARFAREAAGRYDSREARTVHYRDYNIADAPLNLAPAVVARKREVFARYAVHDPMVSAEEPYATWLRGMRYRWPRGDDWAAADAGGRIHAAEVIQRRVVLRGDRELESVVDTPGFEPLAGGVVLLPAPGGRFVLVVQDRRSGDVLVRRRDSAGEWEASWTNLGAPRSIHGETHIGSPAAVIAKDGRVLVAARNDHGGVSVRAEDRAGSGFPPGWVVLGGSGVEDELSMVLDEHESVHVVATARTGMLHWRKTVASGRFESMRMVEQHHPSGVVAVARGPSGRAYAAYSEENTGRLIVLRSADRRWRITAVIEPTSGFAPALGVLSGDSGERPVVAVRSPEGGTVVYEISGANAVRTSVIHGYLTSRTAFAAGTNSLIATGDNGDLISSAPNERGDYGSWQAVR